MSDKVSGSSGNSTSSSQSGTQITPGMMNVYQQLLGINQQRYGNVMNAYSTGTNQLASGLPSVYAGYGNVNANVQNTLGMGQVLGKNGNWGVADPAAQAIGRTYAAAQGNTTQQMTNAGLGNTTAVQAAQLQNTRQAGEAYGSLGAQLADKAAGYQSQIGLAGQGAQMQGLGMQSGFQQGSMGALGQQVSNTAGSLTGGYSSSQSKSTQQGGTGSGSPTDTSTSGGLSSGALNGYGAPGSVGLGSGASGAGGGQFGGLPAIGGSSDLASGYGGAPPYNAVTAYGPQGPLGPSLTNGGLSGTVGGYPSSPGNPSVTQSTNQSQQPVNGGLSGNVGGFPDGTGVGDIASPNADMTKSWEQQQFDAQNGGASFTGPDGKTYQVDANGMVQVPDIVYGKQQGFVSVNPYYAQGWTKK